jgi:hypothetical protein
MATVGCCRRSRSACLAADVCAPRCGLVTPCRARGVRIMTPGEPPAQLDDPLADLVVDVPQVRGESSSSTAASRTLPVGSAGRPTGLMRSRAAAVPRPGQSGPGRHAERPSGRAVVVGHRFPLEAITAPRGKPKLLTRRCASAGSNAITDHTRAIGADGGHRVGGGGVRVPGAETAERRFPPVAIAPPPAAAPPDRATSLLFGLDERRDAQDR